MQTIKITPNLLFEYQCTSGKFIRLPNRIESKKSIRQRESNRNFFCPNWNALSLNTRAQSSIVASHLNSQKHLKQFSDELVRSLLEAVDTAVTVLLLSWIAFILDVNSKRKKCSIRSSISQKTAYISCYLLQENSLSLIVSDLPTNCGTQLQRLTDLKTLLFVIL